jgi:hypothetical protein
MHSAVLQDVWVIARIGLNCFKALFSTIISLKYKAATDGSVAAFLCVARMEYGSKKIKNNICRFQKIDAIFAARTTKGLVVQLVRMPPCHGGGRGFESRPVRIIA